MPVLPLSNLLVIQLALIGVPSKLLVAGFETEGRSHFSFFHVIECLWGLRGSTGRLLHDPLSRPIEDCDSPAGRTSPLNHTEAWILTGCFRELYTNQK